MHLLNLEYNLKGYFENFILLNNKGIKYIKILYFF